MKADLSQLHDIHLPDSILWWPPAPGWWLLLLLLLVLIALAYWFRRRHQKQRWRREALAELQRLQQQPFSAKERVTALSILLRRAAISCFPREEVASLTGEEWLAFLDRQMKKPGFLQQGRLLITAPYSNSADVDTGELCALCERWIRGVAR